MEETIRNKKRFIIITTIFLLFLLSGIAVYINNGTILYQFHKKTTSSLDILRYYANEPFSNAVKLKNIQFTQKNEYKFGKTETLTAYLLVPNSEIDTIFPKEARTYNPKYAKMYSNNVINDVMFSVCKTQMVAKWHHSAIRTISFVIGDKSQNYTRVYITINMLGTNVIKNMRLGEKI